MKKIFVLIITGLFLASGLSCWRTKRKLAWLYIAISAVELITIKENIQHVFNNSLMPYKKIKIIDKKKKTTNIFRSMAEASRFINKNHGYISGKIRKKIFENNDFKWEQI